jgi:TPR repeat protein
MTNWKLNSAAAFALLAAASPLGIAHADVRGGVEAWEAGDYARAVREWRPLAQNGDADAQFNLGQAYKLGRGVAQDMAQAIVWFERAAQQGHIQAEDNLGLVLYESGRRADALSWLERSAARGEPRAQYVLAAELFNGQITTRDWIRAYALMKRSADAGLQRAAAALVQMDQHIPLEQRREGLAMATALETSEGQARLAAMNAAALPRPARTPSRIQPTPIDPSQAGTTWEPRPAPAPAPVVAATPAPAPRPAPAAAPAARTGSFMVQLGAFSSQAAAQAQWSRLAGRFGSASADYQRAGNVVRLRAGPYASRSAAESACVSVRPQACFVVTR